MNRFLLNGHTNSAAVVYGLSSLLEHLGPVWFPDKADQFNQTSKWIKEMAVFYGFIMTQDRNPNPPVTPPPAKDPLTEPTTGGKPQV